MSVFDGIKFPYLNMQQLNLDWILSKIKDILGFIPENGTVGQILRRTADGAEWSDESAPVTSVNGMIGDVIVPYTNPNLLDNWYLVGGGSQNGDGIFPINQQGQTTYSSTGLTIDRWKNNDMSSIQLHSDGVGFYGSGSISSAYQVIDPKQLYGKTLTASVLDNTHHLTVGTAVCPAKPASGWNYETIINATIFNIVIGVKSDGETRLIIQSKNSASFIFSAIKLEIGSYQTLLHYENGYIVFNEMPDFHDQVFKAQRHYVKITNAEFLGHTNSTGTQLSIIIPNVFDIFPTSVTDFSITFIRGQGTGFIQTGLTYSNFLVDREDVVINVASTTTISAVICHCQISCVLSD